MSTGNPEAFLLTSPSYQATGVSISGGITLDWDTSTNATRYLVYLAENGSSINLVNGEEVVAPTTEYTVVESLLKEGTFYKWEVLAINDDYEPPDTGTDDNGFDEIQDGQIDVNDPGSSVTVDQQQKNVEPILDDPLTASLVVPEAVDGQIYGTPENGSRPGEFTTAITVVDTDGSSDTTIIWF